MKFSELRKHIDALAAAVDGIGEKDLALAVRAMSDGFKPFNKRDVAELESISFQAPANTGERPQLREVIFVLAAFDEFVRKSTKPAVREGFNLLRIFVNDRGEMAIRSFFGALHDAFSPDRPKPDGDRTLVQSYVDALRDVKHDDEKFPRLFGQLSNDERLTKEEIVEIANDFAFKMAKSTSRKTALERIWKMHNASETFAAKSRAMKGKSAA
jgi:hypothetical protein